MFETEIKKATEMQQIFRKKIITFDANLEEDFFKNNIQLLKDALEELTLTTKNFSQQIKTGSELMEKVASRKTAEMEPTLINKLKPFFSNSLS
jgi:hypothetical protein